MQKLQWEKSWDKAVATQDREQIELIFLKTKDLMIEDILFTPIREAINHKKEFLVTVLVHNFTDQELIFDQTRLVYAIGNEIMARHLFTIPMLIIPPKASMPWTFIFPEGSYIAASFLENGRLQIHSI
ncbi:SLAP domain-containing protein [Psychrobacillus sp. FSL K6-2684]|uniref:SLAP domain-containing protein n=1 Tax=Psychrobacillus faecigallinarum TaxID=2762235 RepID=A0ABR8R951_9BACI|nr:MULTISPECIES: SLAP domain-containing protein [Psychrobacillus]MBD7944275.1 SLAP domain-containing protein [Psychrobacillus faecigallinarum]QEY21131.1 SLAP domain-containing protein [Psychrobacillus sp. AK 1817]